jgi:hypothetical protein
MRIVASAVWHAGRRAPSGARLCLNEMLPNAGDAHPVRLPEYEVRYDTTLHLKTADALLDKAPAYFD